MTTLKELKELDAKATSAPWHYEIYPEREYFQVETDMDAIVTNSRCYNEFNDNDHKLIAATRNVLPDLIRVIELAEDELNHVDKVIKELKTDKYGRFRPTKAQGEAIWFSVSQALTEIRKLKGE